MIINELFLNQLTPAIQNFVELGVNRRPSVVPLIYSMATSSRYMERMETVTSISPDAWDQFEGTGVTAADDFMAIYPKNFVHQEKTIKVYVRVSSLEDGDNTAIAATAERVGISAFANREQNAASVFNNAFTAAAFAGPDGVALCSASHPQSGGTVSNTGTTALSSASVEATRVLMMNYTSDKGAPLGLVPDTLLVPPALEATALTIANSLQLPGTGNNDINPRYGQYRVITWPYLTDSNNWFMIDSVQAMTSLKWFDRVPLGLKFASVDSSVAVWNARMRYSYGFADWRWIYGHDVT